MVSLNEEIKRLEEELRQKQALFSQLSKLQKTPTKKRENFALSLSKTPNKGGKKKHDSAYTRPK